MSNNISPTSLTNGETFDTSYRLVAFLALFPAIISPYLPCSYLLALADVVEGGDPIEDNKLSFQLCIVGVRRKEGEMEGLLPPIGGAGRGGKVAKDWALLLLGSCPYVVRPRDREGGTLVP